MLRRIVCRQRCQLALEKSFVFSDPLLNNLCERTVSYNNIISIIHGVSALPSRREKQKQPGAVSVAHTSSSGSPQGTFSQLGMAGVQQHSSHFHSYSWYAPYCRPTMSAIHQLEDSLYQRNLHLRKSDKLPSLWCCWSRAKDLVFILMLQ